MPFGGAQETRLASSLPQPIHLVFAGGSAVWNQAGSTATDGGALLAMPVASPDGGSGGIVTVAAGLSGSEPLAADGALVYWLAEGGDIRACGVPDCASGPREVLVGASNGATGGLAVVSGTGFWGSKNAIMSCTLSSCSPTALLTGVTNPRVLAASTNAVAFTSAEYAAAIVAR